MGASPWWYYPIVIFCMVVLSAASMIYYCNKFCNLNIWQYFKAIPIPCFIVSVIVLTIGFAISWALPQGMIRLLVNMAVMSLALMIGVCWLLSSKEKQLLTGFIQKIYHKIV